MKRILITLFSAFLATLSVYSAQNPGDIHTTTLDEVKSRFADPPAAFRPAPLWVWNDDMQEDEISRQLDELKAGGFGGVFVHPRPGLITPYLSDRWLELWRHTALEAQKRGMVTYIYDENSYPSGFAGGFVPDQMPDAAQLSLEKKEFAPDQTDQIKISRDVIALYRVTDESTGAFERVPLPPMNDDAAASQLKLPNGRYILYSQRAGGPSPWYGGKTFVDLMRPDVTKRFLDITFGAYDRVLSGLYGSDVLASFTDEPQVAGAWSTMIPEAFKARWGYDILDNLPSLHADVGDWRRVRNDYSATILQLFMNNFAKPYSEACEERGIAFTGHVWEHGWPHLNHNPDIMSFYSWQDWPGIDCLMNQYSESANAQFGNYRSNRELDSIANQLGKVRRLCETYGAGGWDLTLEDVKRIGDHLLAGGINLINPHLSYYTIRGARKRDHPQSFSYHEPYWEAFHIPMDYLGRLSWSLAGGESDNPILVIEPTVTMWMYNWSPTQNDTLSRLGEAFQQYITRLGAEGVAFDLGSEPVMADHASVKNGELIVGERAYKAVILPPGLEGLQDSTVKLLIEYVKQDGTIVSLAGTPAYVDGRTSDAPQEIKKAAGKRWIEGDLSTDDLAKRWSNGGVFISAQPPSDGRVYHYVRTFNDGKLVFVINTSLTESASAALDAEGARSEQWNAVTGSIEGMNSQHDGGRVRWEVSLPPAGSALFAVYTKPDGNAAPEPEALPAIVKEIAPDGEMSASLDAPNVLTLDYVDLVLNGETTEGLYFYDAQTRIYQAHGFDRNPWDNAVQFKDEIIQKDHFADDSGFELRYPFTLEGFSTPPALRIVIERGGQYEVSINGHTIEPQEGEYWLDRSFSVYDIEPQWLKAGRNVVSTVAKPFSLFMEPEAIYVLGDFDLNSSGKGFTIAPSTPLHLGAWNQQGKPFYSDKATYTQTFTLKPGESQRFAVELINWLGTAARVDVNGKLAGYILWKPWRIDTTPLMKAGDNTVNVTIFGGLKNVLGPHHAGKLRGSAWPGSFWQHPKDGQPAGEAYDFMEYGMMEPFVLSASGE
ncbi:MAG: hypothetical protein GC154_09605 [bacterium]|nr:hypothetical protein [bacterium]